MLAKYLFSSILGGMALKDPRVKFIGPKYKKLFSSSICSLGIDTSSSIIFTQEHGY
jgi:hypothetical protein